MFIVSEKVNNGINMSYLAQDKEDLLILYVSMSAKHRTQYTNTKLSFNGYLLFYEEEFVLDLFVFGL